MPGEFGALLEEALGREPAPVLSPRATEGVEGVEGVDGVDGSLVVAVSARATIVDRVALEGDSAVPPRDTVPLGGTDRPESRAPTTDVGANGSVSDLAPRAGSLETAETVETSPTPADAVQVLTAASVTEVAAAVDVTGTAPGPVPRPATVDGRVELDPDWMDRPLLRQPVVLKPGASVGSPDGSSYIANPGTIPVTFVPSGTGGDPSAGTYFVDPAEVAAAAAGPLGLLTGQLMAQLSGHPYPAASPTSLQMAIIEAARRAGLRFGA